MSFSVLMSVYAMEIPQYLDHCFQSLLTQTLNANEIVLVKDGPLTSELDAVISSWELKLGDVLKVISLDTNMGLAYALNEGIKVCKYDLIIRMDTDDIALPYRFEIQVKFMRHNPNVVASSGSIEEFDDSGSILGLRKLPESHDEIVRFAKRRSPLSHPAVIFRKDVVQKVGGYPLYRNAQDYALWSVLIVNGYKLANIKDVLVKMRAGSGMYKRRGYEFLKKEIELLRFQRQIGFLSRYEFLFNLCSRTVLRMAPLSLKKWLYKVAR